MLAGLLSTRGDVIKVEVLVSKAENEGRFQTTSTGRINGVEGTKMSRNGEGKVTLNSESGSLLSSTSSIAPRTERRLCVQV